MMSSKTFIYYIEYQAGCDLMVFLPLGDIIASYMEGIYHSVANYFVICSHGQCFAHALGRIFARYTHKYAPVV